MQCRMSLASAIKRTAIMPPLRSDRPETRAGDSAVTNLYYGKAAGFVPALVRSGLPLLRRRLDRRLRRVVSAHPMNAAAGGRGRGTQINVFDRCAVTQTRGTPDELAEVHR